MNRQLALRIQPNEESTFANYFWSEENHWVKAQLRETIEGSSERLIYLWGHCGAGKSHLLQACVHEFGLSKPAIYLPLHLIKTAGPVVLEGLEEQALLCVDDVDCVSGDPLWEEAIFHLYNRVRDEGRSILILSGRTSPRSSSIVLPDLRSRLGGSLVLQVHELDDESKIQNLCLQAQKRGLELPVSVAHFLVSRCARNMHDLHQLLMQLDEASWVMQRKLTIPFVKATLGL
jgi:DnaA-homolog protein